MILNKLILLLFLSFLISCNSNKSEEEMEELWSKAQTRNEIIERSGTKSGNKGADAAMSALEMISLLRNI